MRKGFSLQWKLTLMTAFLVIIACLSLSYFIGKSAVFYMDNIEDSITTIFPQELFSDNSSGNVEVYIDTTQMISDMVRDTQVEFLALVREIARQHGGDVCVLQSSTQGTQMELSLLCS